MALAGCSGGPFAQGLTAPSGGVHPSFGNQLAAVGTASMTVNVDTGLVYMGGSTAWQGTYAGVNTGLYGVTVPAANSSQWRSDYICAQQLDTAYAGATDTWDIVDVPGTFSGSAPGSLPALPASSVPIAIVRVVPNMTATNGGGTVVDARRYTALPGPLYTTSTNKPALTCPEGTMWFETDSNKLGIIISGAYVYLYAPADPWHTMSLTNSWTNRGAGFPTAKYRLITSPPNSVQIVGAISAGTLNVAFASALPAAYIPATLQSLVADVRAFTTTTLNTIPALDISTAGVPTLGGLPAGTTVVHFNGIYSLDA
jgi:hypothetical protein